MPETSYVAPASPPGILGSIAAFAANPVVGLATGVVGLVGQGINSWINAKRQREAREDADRKHNEYMALERDKYEANLAYQQQRLGLDRTSLMAKLRQQKVQNENYYDERNYSRANDWYTKTMNQLNQPDMKNKLQTIYAQAA